jgi:hypothetical protein
MGFNLEPNEIALLMERLDLSKLMAKMAIRVYIILATFPCHDFYMEESWEHRNLLNFARHGRSNREISLRIW